MTEQEKFALEQSKKLLALQNEIFCLCKDKYKLEIGEMYSFLRFITAEVEEVLKEFPNFKDELIKRTENGLKNCGLEGTFKNVGK